MRLNALHPEDNPMEALLFCFGGDGGGGGGGGDTQDSQMDELDQISADFDNMDAQISAGETVTSGAEGGVGRGGDSNDNDGDGIPNSIDATPGVDRSTIGAEQDAFDLSEDYLDEAITDFATPPDGGVDMPPADQSMTAGYPTETLQAGLVPDITVTVPQTPDELDAQLDAITQQFEDMSDLIDEGQGVAVTGSGDVLGLDSYDRAREEAVTNAVNAYKNNPDIQNSTTLNPEDPANIANLESKLADMSLDQIDTFARDLGGLEEGERSYGLPYSFEPPEVEVTLLPGDYEPTGFEDTFVSQDMIGAGVPVSTLPEGSYQIDAATNTVSLNEAGKSYMDALAKGYRNEPNEFGIDRQEIDSLMEQGAVVGSPMVQIPTERIGEDGAIAGAEARAGEGEDEAGLPGGSGGAGRLGESAQQATIEETPGVIRLNLVGARKTADGNVVLDANIPAVAEEEQEGVLPPSEGEAIGAEDVDPTGLGFSEKEGGVGLLPGEGGIIGTDSGIIGQSGDDGFNPFTEGGDGGEGDETVRASGPGESQEGEGPGAGDGTGTGTPPDLVSGEGGEGGDDGFEPAPPVQTDPYDFGSGEYDPLLDFEYRQPQITSPFDFARDFGSYTLSPEIEQSFQDLTADRLAQGFEPAALYEPEFLEQIGIMSPERQAEEGIASLIGSRFPQFTPAGERYPFDSTPEESAQSIVDSLLAGE